ncbi:MAG: hypothetical protein LAN84_14885 [Acidobacteriia bacterium]|nr:hypothetical protein [Terriglobia bacterium]
MTSQTDGTKSAAAGGGPRAWLPALLVCAAAALTLVAPFYGRGIPSGHDIEFHASNWMEVAGQWKAGIPCPSWAEWANWGFGEPRFVFYPPLGWMLGAALGLLAGWQAAVAAVVVVTQTTAGLCMFALARRTLPLRAALFAGAVYAANPYAQMVVYLRSDFAELLGAAFFPLLLLFAGELADAADGASARRRAALFAVCFSLVWLANAPAGVLASYSVALLFAEAAARERCWRPLLRGAGGLGLGFGLCAFYLLPAVYEQRWVNIAQVLSSGLLPAENFLYSTTADPEHNVVNGIISSAAAALIAVTALAALAAQRRGAAEGPRRQRQRLLLLGAAAAALMWRFTAPLWSVLPKLRYLQFPWRWMLVLAVALAWLAAAALARRRFAWLGAAALLLALGGSQLFFVRHAYWDTEDIAQLRAAIASGAGYEGTDEYDPLGDDHTDLPQHAPRVRLLPAGEDAADISGAKARIERWTAEEKLVRVSARTPVHAALRLLNYPAWRVEVNGAVVQPERAEETQQMIVPLAAGESRIAVRFRRTADRTLGGGLSILSALCAIALWRGAAGGGRKR